MSGVRIRTMKNRRKSIVETVTKRDLPHWYDPGKHDMWSVLLNRVTTRNVIISCVF